MVTPLQASIIMQFQDQKRLLVIWLFFLIFFLIFLRKAYVSVLSKALAHTCSWKFKDLAAAVGVPVDVLNRRINFWVSKVIFCAFIE